MSPAQSLGYTLISSVVLCCLCPRAEAQLSDLQPGRNFPTAVIAFGANRTENIDVGDCDLDGDYDVMTANGGDGAKQQNKIFINNGGIQGGTPGTFTNESATRLAGITNDRSRDVEFADFDADGDLDIYVSNRGTTIDGGETSRAYANLGGMQLGSVGFFVEVTNVFWGTLLSVPMADQVFGGNLGPFRDYSCDCDFGDIDLDGDVDLFHSSYGPNIAGNRDSRIFVNDGNGRFDELWPWADGAADIKLHTLDIDLFDIDGDFDIDVFASSRDSQARVYRNDLQADGSWPADPFVDVTQTSLIDTGAIAVTSNNYESEFADVDGDGDFDVWMKNYDEPGGNGDRILRNDGGMVFTKMAAWIKGDPNNDENEVDFLDFDNDGDLDAIAANFSGTNWLYQSGLADGVPLSQGLYHRTGTSASGSLASWPETPSSSNGGTSLDGECADMDGDGDTDILLANDSNENNRYWENTLAMPDTHAPSVYQLTVAGDKSDGSDTPIRVALRDNAAYYVVAFYGVDLLYSVNGGTENRLKMFSQGGQQFQAVIPGGLNGTIAYRVVGSDDAGNSFSSSTVSYVQTSSGVTLFESLDDGTPGVVGNPYLELRGSLTANSPLDVVLLGGAPGATAVVFLSLASTPTPFKGGLLYTVPVISQIDLSTNPGGQIWFDATWPPGAPTGVQVWFQCGVADTTAVGGASLSNAVKATTP